MKTVSDSKQAILDVAAQLGLAMQVEFVPFSRSRSADEKVKSLNWKITLTKNGKPVLTTDYGAGCGHCPSYKQGDNSVDYFLVIGRECETGRSKAGAILPDLADVLHSLAGEADALDHPTYESWAGDLGFDEDSRKGEAIYRECLKIALQLRAALGEQGLEILRGAVQDY